MRQTEWIPSECEKLFFCLNGLTTGVPDKHQCEAKTILFSMTVSLRIKKNVQTNESICKEVVLTVECVIENCVIEMLRRKH